MAISNIIKKAGKTVINATANLISAPAQIKAAMAQSQANSDVATIKRARSYDNAPIFSVIAVSKLLIFPLILF